ncbi:MAG: FkbM family methyltransferase [Desulfobacterales bacterium]|jgi:FkbM family methyltransferase|nr:FkbM family methyltransferase [Desulfobacterales bacterium]
MIDLRLSSGRSRKHPIGALVGTACALLVQRSYRHRGAIAHRCIQAIGRSWYGLRKTHPLCRRLCSHLKDSICSAQEALFRAGQLKVSELGPAPIGFAGLKAWCSATNINSALVYLLGFSDNLAMFEIYRRFAAPGTVAVDVGANLGIHALVLAACVGKGGKVHAFEPVPSICARLAENLKLNGVANVELHPEALGNASGEVVFDANPSDFNIGKGRVTSQGNVIVPIDTLDECLREEPLPVSLIKIDVEGHELEVLKGGVDTLEKQRPVLVMEFNPSEYSLREIRQLIPHRYAFFELAERLDEEAVRGDDRLRHRCDLLIAPCERLRR